MMEPDKERKYQDEIERLKSFLVQLDKQISEESLAYEKRVAVLETTLSRRDEQIADLQSRLDLDHEAVIEQLEEENRQLKGLLSHQETSLHKTQAERDNLASALDMMHANVQEEINMHLLTAQQENRRLKGQVAELQRNLEKAHEGQKFSESSQRHNDPLTSKLYRDLEMQNHLIDQLNDEVNGLKRRMQDMVKGCDENDGYVSKQYIRSLIVSLTLPPRGTTRMEIWNLLIKALGMTDEEVHKLGVLRGQGSSSTEPFHQGLSDVWISFLLHETAENSTEPSGIPP